MQFKCSVTTVRTWELYGGPVVCSYTDGGSCGEVTSIRGWVCLLETEIQKWGTNLVSTMWTTKYKERNKFWCEQMFVIFNCFFQVAIFYSTLGKRVDELAVPCAAWTREVSHFLKRSDCVRRPPTYLVCIAGSCFQGKTAVAWSWPPTSSQCWVTEWVELYLNCSTRSHDVHSHNFAFSPLYNHSLYNWEVWWGFRIVWCIQWLACNIL